MSHETMEPDDGHARLTPVTAQNPGTERAHDAHDRLLVARFATGDALAADEAGAVRALLAACIACNELVADLQVVQHATATSLAPRRPRDFFLTAEQAETLRPNAWQRLLARLSAPRSGALRPLAGATLAIGIVLVGASAVLPKGDTVLVQEPGPIATGTFFAPEMDNVAGIGPGASSFDGTARQGDPTAAKASPASDSAAGMAESSPVTSSSMESIPQDSPAPRSMMMARPSGPPAAQPTAATADIRIATTPAPIGVDQADPTVASAPTQVASDSTGSALLILGLLLAAVSILVLVLTWLARRTIDPLLR